MQINLCKITQVESCKYLITNNLRKTPKIAIWQGVMTKGLVIFRIKDDISGTIGIPAGVNERFEESKTASYEEKESLFFKKYYQSRLPKGRERVSGILQCK